MSLARPDWEHCWYARGRAVRVYFPWLWSATIPYQDPHPTAIFPGCVLLAQQRQGSSRQAFFYDCARRPRRWPGAYRVDAITLLPIPRKFATRKRTFEDKTLCEMEIKRWRDTWRKILGEQQLPMWDHVGWGIRSIVGRCRDWYQPRMSRVAILRSELGIESDPFSPSMSYFSFLCERTVRVDFPNRLNRDTLAHDGFEICKWARVAEIVQIEYGMQSVWQRCWGIQHRLPGPRQSVPCLDAPTDSLGEHFINHQTITLGIESEKWDGAVFVPRDRQASYEHHRRWQESHSPPKQSNDVAGITIDANGNRPLPISKE